MVQSFVPFLRLYNMLLHSASSSSLSTSDGIEPCQPPSGFLLGMRSCRGTSFACEPKEVKGKETLLAIE